MKRREFLEASGALAGAALGGVMWGRAVYARSELTNQLVAEVSPLLVAKEHSEIASLPDTASEEMKLWFTGACLNSAQFVEYICSEGFASRLGQFSTTREKELCVENEFLARVVSHSEIYQRIDLIAKETGTILDRNWKSCCDEIAGRWKLKLDAKSQNFGGETQTRLDSIVSAELDQMISRSANVADRPSALSSTIGIGKASIMVLPLARLGPQVFLPAFALIALANFANYAIGAIFQDTAAAKIAISDRMALLGNRVATEFDTELKTRIADLHAWQNKALRNTAGEYAHEAIGII
jgi:hypothetical protein